MYNDLIVELGESVRIKITLRKKIAITLVAIMCLNFFNCLSLPILAKTEVEDKFQKSLLRRSTDIITAKVVSKESKWIKTKNGDLIYTFADVDIIDNAKGSLIKGNKIKLVYLGGKVGETEIALFVNPYGKTDFEIGDIVNVYTKLSTKHRNCYDILSSEVVSEETPVLSNSLFPVLGLKSVSVPDIFREEYRCYFESLGLYWDSSDFPITYRINANSSPVANGDDEIEDAFIEWEGDNKSDIDFTRGSDTSVDEYDNTDGIQALFWNDNDYFKNYNAKLDECIAGALIRATSGRMTYFDVGFNTFNQWSVAESVGCYHIQSIATHEIGHTFGLNDLYFAGSDTPAQTMYKYTSTNNDKKASIEDGDEAGVRYLYEDSSYPSAGVDIDTPSGGYVSGNVQISADVSGGPFDSVQVAITHQDNGNFETGWTSMTYSSGQYHYTWTCPGDSGEAYYIIVKALKSSGNYGYDVVQVIES